MSLLRMIPGHPLRGEVRLPGDKSLSHRAALFAALADGESRAENFLQSGVTDAMLNCLTALGVDWRLEDRTLTVVGRGLSGLRRTDEASLYCGNSATTLRLLTGAVAAAGIPAVLDGSDGLRRRPMARITEPLRQMGVDISAAQGECAPLHIAPQTNNQKLKSVTHVLPVASAQVKSCLMLAGLAADGATTIIEPSRSRDHSERMLAAMGARVVSGPAADGGWQIVLQPPQGELTPLNLNIPGDFSAAAFLIVAALITPGSEVRIQGVGLNPTRTGLLETLCEMGADIQVLERSQQGGEPVGDLLVRAGKLHAGQVSGQRVVDMIDEFPVFAVAAAYAQGDTQVSDARELRYKESDRIGSLCAELRAIGAAVDEAEDGFTVHGSGALPGGSAQSHQDHRLAMSLAVAGLAAQNPIEIEGAEIVAESFPEFVDQLTQLGAHVERR